MTEHFTLKEFCRSQAAEDAKIPNLPLGNELAALHFTAAGMERVRACLGFPIKINSGYRSPQVNKLVGGSVNSQHCKGEAVDFVCPAFGTPLKICQALRGSMKILGIDQLIQEGTWVHISFTQTPRYQILTKRSDGSYAQGLV